MKQMRKLGNLIAEELIHSGMNESDDAFEGRVEKIVSMVCEAVEDAVKDNESEIDEDVEVEDILMATEDFTIGDLSIAEDEFVEVLELDFDTDLAVINHYDADGEVKAEEVEVNLSDLMAFSETAETLDLEEGYDFDSLDAIEDDEEDLDEDFHIRGGKKIKFSSKIEKLREKLKAKKTGKVNKFTIKDGKIVRKSSEQIKADKKKSKTFARLMKKFKNKRAKSLKKARKFMAKESFEISSNGASFVVESGDILSVENNVATVLRDFNEVIRGVAVDEEFINRCLEKGVISNSRKFATVSEQFIISSNGVRFTAKVGDQIVLDEGVVTIIRGNTPVVEGISVSSNFLDRCVLDKVVECKDCDDDEEKKTSVSEDDSSESGDEANENTSGDADDADEEAKPADKKDAGSTVDESTLTFKSGRGYVLIREGKEIPMGNRVRARAFLTSNGYNIKSDMLDMAAEGKMVTINK